MIIQGIRYPMVRGRQKMRKSHIGVQLLNWTLFAISLGGAALAGTWTSGILLGVFLPESMAMPAGDPMNEALTVFDYMASGVAGLWIGYVIFFVLWECILKRFGMLLRVEDPVRGLLAKWR